MTNKPTHIVSVEIKKNDDTSYWHRIGAAFPIKNGYKIVLNSAPIGRELFIFDAEKAPAEDSPNPLAPKLKQNQ